MLTEPTSLNRGEGLVTGSPGDVGSGVGASEGGGRERRWWKGGGEVEERWWWTKENEIQPLMGLMVN
jgi:hypothetical protein